jgi:hypothetical protein
LLWIGWVALDKLKFIAVPSDKELDAFFHYSGRFQEAHNNKMDKPAKTHYQDYKNLNCSISQIQITVRYCPLAGRGPILIARDWPGPSFFDQPQPM